MTTSFHIESVVPSEQGSRLPPERFDTLVATEVTEPDGVKRCPAAPLLEGQLRRRGLSVARGRITAVPASGATAADTPTWEWLRGADDTGSAVWEVAAADSKSREEVRKVLAAAEETKGRRTVLLASPRSFCAGVERAIEVVWRALEQHGAPVYVRKQIVHNTHVVEELRGRGAVFVDELAEVPSGSVVVFSAHGVAPEVHDEAEKRGLRVIDATCPLVAKVHAEARRFAERGDTIVLIGSRDHEEVEGTSGEAPHETVVVESVADVADVEVPDPTRVSYLTQTTLTVDETAEVIAALRERFPALRGPGSEDICYAATNRQGSVRAVADESDLVLVVGSRNSANSRHLVELARRRGTQAHLVDGCEDIRLDWLFGAEVIGVTAGASAPPGLVDEVVNSLGGLGPVAVDERVTTVETTHFGLPKAVR